MIWKIKLALNAYSIKQLEVPNHKDSWSIAALNKPIQNYQDPDRKQVQSNPMKLSQISNLRYKLNLKSSDISSPLLSSELDSVNNQSVRKVNWKWHGLISSRTSHANRSTWAQASIWAKVIQYDLHMAQICCWCEDAYRDKIKYKEKRKK